MELNNIKSLLIKSLNKTWKQNQVISSIIYNSIINDFLEIKKINIRPYIISIKIIWNKIILKTRKPIINAEILNVKDLMIKNINLKLNKIWINISDLELKLK
jgi:hypothetical protein